MLLDLTDALKHQGESRLFSLEGMLPDNLIVGEIQLAAPVRINGTVTAMGHQVAVVGRIHAQIRTQCALCLKETYQELDCDYDELLVHADYAAQGRGDGGDSDDEEVVLFEGSACDLTQSIAQTLNLHMPMRILCKVDCKGLCPKCGKNLNEGPCACESESDLPFARLKILLKDEEV